MVRDAATHALFTLDAKGHPVYEPDFSRWMRWYSLLVNRRVAYDVLGGLVTVSTIFLGYDHGTDGSPVFFHTLITGGAFHRYQSLASTYEQAQVNHGEAVMRIRTRSQPLEDFTDG